MYTIKSKPGTTCKGHLIPGEKVVLKLAELLYKIADKAEDELRELLESRGVIVEVVEESEKKAPVKKAPVKTTKKD
jgi:hypothetical protein